MNFSVTTNDGGIMQALDGIKRGPRRQIMAKAMRIAVKPLPSMVKAATPRETGALRKYISSKVTALKTKAIAYGIVGARTGSKEQKVRKSSWSTKPQDINPVRYAHLVNKGTKPHSISVKGGKSFQHPGAKAQPFIPQVAAAQKASTVSRFVTALKSEYDKAWTKALGKGKTIRQTAGTQYSRAARGYIPE